MKFGFDFKKLGKVLLSSLGEFLLIMATLSIGLYLTSSGKNGFPMWLNIIILILSVIIKSSMEK